MSKISEVLPEVIMHCKTCGNYLVDEGEVCKVCGTVATGVNPPTAPTTSDSSEESWPWEDTNNSSAPTNNSFTDQNYMAGNEQTAHTINPDGGLFSQPTSNVGAQNTPFSNDPSPQNDSNRLFDFSWDNDEFPTEEPKAIEDIDFSWGTFDPHAKPDTVKPKPIQPRPVQEDASKQIADIGKAARERDAQEMAARRVNEAETIFSDDTADFVTQPNEDQSVFNQNNEAFQEFLDNEVEKVQSRKTNIDESMNQINDDILSAPVEAPESIVGESKYSPNQSIDDRIASFLEKADREMLEAMNARINQQIQEKDSEEISKPSNEAASDAMPQFGLPEASQDSTSGISLTDEKVGIPTESKSMFDANAFSSATNEDNPVNTTSEDTDAEKPEKDDVFLVSDIFATENTSPGTPSSFEAPTNYASSSNIDKEVPTTDTPLATSFEDSFEDSKVASNDIFSSFEPVGDFESVNAPTNNAEPSGIAETPEVEGIAEAPEVEGIAETPEPTEIPEVPATEGIASFMASLEAEPNKDENQTSASQFEQPDTFDNKFMPVENSDSNYGTDYQAPISQPKEEEKDLLEELMNSNMASIAATKSDSIEPQETVTTESFLQDDSSPLEDTADETTPTDSSKEDSIASAFATGVPEQLENEEKPESVMPDQTDSQFAEPKDSTSDETTPTDIMEEDSDEQSVSDIGDLTPVDPERINEPVVFPFDLEPDEDDKSEAKLEAKEAKRADRFDKEIKMSDSKENLKSAKTEAKEAKKAAKEEYKRAMAEAKGKPYSPSTSKPATSKASVSSNQDTNAPLVQTSSEPEAKKSKALFIVVDIVVVLAILAVCAFAILRFAPESGAAEFIQNGISKVVGIFDKSAADSVDDATEEMAKEAENIVIPPTADMNTLVNGQLFNNKNIRNIVHSPDAVFQSDKAYTIEGISTSTPIENNYWTDGDQGQVMYDEQAVATIIRFNSNLVSYINDNNQAIFEDIEMGSNAEPKLAGFIASIDKIDFTTLGIGEIRTDGKNFFVWTIETITETVNSKESQKTYKRVYMLTPDIETMKVSDFEEIN